MYELNNENFRMQKKTVIVTGSSKGIGSQVITHLARSNFNIVINYRKNKKNALKLNKKLSKFTQTEILQGDVTKISDVTRIVNKTIKSFGRIDVLINNAGIHEDNIVLKMSHKSWKKVIDTNLNGTFNFSKAVLPLMIKQKFGRIINISSITASMGTSGAANYSASKAGVIGFTKSLAKEVAKHNVTANVIAPGYFDIGIFYDIDPLLRKKIVNSIPSKRLGRSEEISELIQILISSNYLTGQVFILDGGYSA